MGKYIKESLLELKIEAAEEELKELKEDLKNAKKYTKKYDREQKKIENQEDRIDLLSIAVFFQSLSGITLGILIILRECGVI